jgi:hypothetical protein
MGCDVPREQRTESPIPRDYWSHYTGTQPSYEMRDRNDKVIVFNGKTIPVPAIKNSIEIEARGISWQQESQQEDRPRTVKYGLALPSAIQTTKDFLIVECQFANEETTSNPTRRFGFDHVKKTATMLGDHGSADCLLEKEESNR